MQSPPHSSKGIHIFYSYAPKDKEWQIKLQKHFSGLKQVSHWHHGLIDVGKEWLLEIDKHLNAAHIILLLVSPDFMASEHCLDFEAKKAFEKHKKSDVRVIPVIIRPIDWKHAYFGQLQPLPRNGKAVSQCGDSETSLFDVAEEIRKVIEELRMKEGLNEDYALDNGKHFQKILAEFALSNTQRDYLSWLIERNLYLDPRGTIQKQRQVPMKLDEVYISLRAQYEKAPGIADRSLLEQELAQLEAKMAKPSTSAEEIEDQRERLMAYREEGLVGEKVSGEILELAEVIKRHDHVVVLGDPGSGKSTLLRYLALKHAQALSSGRNEVDTDLGAVRFPLFIRIADYAEYGLPKGKSLSEFLTDYHSLHECPMPGLSDLLVSELKKGNSLVLFDGLDEIVSADDRRKVVVRIEDFIRYHDNCSNRFVITSRRAAYRSAPLGDLFVEYVVQDMDEEQIHRFLERWCIAVEATETPDLSQEAREIVAKREIDAIMKAVKSSSGVRRLASNPLLLRTLALIHRTSAQLPQKRIELYKQATEILAHTWRKAQGVPESALALVGDRYLTRLLEKLAYWMHENKSTGIATEQEVYRELGQEYARIEGIDWDEDNPDRETKVENFLQAVREHTGIFVERAPNRYGFMHLTFQEYYAARYLVARSKDRTRSIRRHLHKARWEEPILLALGLVSLDSPDDAAELLETAIMAEGEEAKELGLTPSLHEKLLGRDFLFVLRCLGDNISARPRFVRLLAKRLVDELTYQTGPARFKRYQKALDDRFKLLRKSEAAPELLFPLMKALQKADGEAYSNAHNHLIRLCKDSPQVVTILCETLRATDPQNRFMAAWSLKQVYEYIEASPEVITALHKALQDTKAQVRYMAAGSLGDLKAPPLETVKVLSKALSDAHPRIRYQAAMSLGQLGQVSPQIVTTLIEALSDKNPQVREEAADRLGRLECLDQISAQAAAIALVEVLHDAADPELREKAAWSLGRVGHTSPQVTNTLIEALQDTNPQVRSYAVLSLGKVAQASPEAIIALLQSLHDNGPDMYGWATKALVRLGNTVPEGRTILIEALRETDTHLRSEVEMILASLSQNSPEVVAALVEALHDTDPHICEGVVHVLKQLNHASPQVVGFLTKLLQNPDSHVREVVTASLEQIHSNTSMTVADLVQALNKTDPDVRSRAAQSLGQSGQNSVEIITALNKALDDVHPHVRDWAATSLLQLGQVSSEVLTVFIEALCGTTPEIDNRAYHMVFSWREISPSPEVIDILNKALHNANEKVRFWAAGSLVLLGQASSRAITILVKISNGFSSDYLGGWAYETPETVTILSEMLRDTSHLVRSWAVEHLIILGQILPEVIVALIEFIQNSNPDVRKEAAQTLGKLERRQISGDAIVALTQALDNENVEVKYAAAVSLGKLAPATPEMREKVVEALEKSKDESTRGDSAKLLGRQWLYDERTVQLLQQKLLDEDGRVRTACAEALARLGQRFPIHAEKIAEKLKQAIESPEFDEPEIDILNDPNSFLRGLAHDHAYNSLWLMISNQPEANEEME